MAMCSPRWRNATVAARHVRRLRGPRLLTLGSPGKRVILDRDLAFHSQTAPLLNYARRRGYH